MIKTAKELAEAAKNTAKNQKTTYMSGVFGAPVTKSILSQKAKQYPAWYTESRVAVLKNLVGQGYFGFDCVCFLKALLWGWNGDAKKTYGGAVYASNGVPDVNELGMLQVCTDVSADFSRIRPGEYLWMDGHCGIYIGDGLAAECTPAWKNGVQVTAVWNLEKKDGYNGRVWTKHGKLPYVTYEAEQSGVSVALRELKNGSRGKDVKALQQLLTAKRYALPKYGADGEFGGETEAALKQYQWENGLDADGICGRRTWSALLGVTA